MLRVLVPSPMPEGVISLLFAFGAGGKRVRSDDELSAAVKFTRRSSDVPLLTELAIDSEDLPPLNMQGSLMF